jgi:YHS domain-containing protein
MNRRTLVSCSLAAALCLAGFAFAESTSGTNASATTTQPAAVDLHNTKCPVSGDDVGDSKITETYNGKIYHICCADCPATFKKDAAKYEKAVAADPAKYGIKTSK